MSAIVTTKAASREKSGGATLHGEIGQLLRQYRYQVGFTYCLLLGENSLRLLQPLLLGIAVNDLLQNSQQGLWWFVAGHAGMMSVQYTRQLYDTRVFSRMYAHRASGLVQQQRHQAVETSRIVARASLSRQFISFIEQQVPSLVTAAVLVSRGHPDARLLSDLFAVCLPVAGGPRDPAEYFLCPQSETGQL